MSNPTGYETIARFRGGEVLASARRVVVIGTPDDATDANGDSLHNCDAMGCGQSHVVAIVDRPAPHYPPMPGTGAPRDPSRIEPILARLRAAWHRSPDLRLGQLIVGSIPIGHLDRADAIRRLFNAECHEFGAAGAPVEWPAPSTAAQPPPVLDLDALAEAERAMTVGPWAISPQTDGPDDVAPDEWATWCEIDAPSEQCVAQCTTAGDSDAPNASGIVALRNAAPHLIAEARAAVALRQELAALRAHFDAAAPEHNLPALLDLYNDRTTEARAEIARLTAELDAARQIADARREWLGTGDAAKSPPRTDTGAIAADMLACAEAWAPGAMLMGNVRADEIAAVCRELAGARTVPPDVEAAIDARDAEWQNRIMPFHKGFDGDGCESGDPIDWTLSALSQAKCTVEDAVGDFIEGHAKRLCDAAGGVWHDEYDSWASQVHDVLNHLRADVDGTVIDGRASKPATVGGLAAAPRCSCTREAGDSRCDAHPSCSECGDQTARNVDDCADHCQACASLRRGDVITDVSKTCNYHRPHEATRGDLPQKGG